MHFGCIFAFPSTRLRSWVMNSQYSTRQGGNGTRQAGGHWLCINQDCTCRSLLCLMEYTGVFDAHLLFSGILVLNRSIIARASSIINYAWVGGSNEKDLTNHLLVICTGGSYRRSCAPTPLCLHVTKLVVS